VVFGVSPELFAADLIDEDAVEDAIADGGTVSVCGGLGSPAVPDAVVGVGAAPAASGCVLLASLAEEAGGGGGAAGEVENPTRSCSSV